MAYTQASGGTGPLKATASRGSHRTASGVGGAEGCPSAGTHRPWRAGEASAAAAERKDSGKKGRREGSRRRSREEVSGPHDYGVVIVR